MKPTFVRSVARKSKINQLLQGKFIEGTEEVSSHILTQTQKVTRCDVMGSIVHKEQVGNITNLLLDDGSGRIVVRIFEESDQVNKLTIGSTVLIIGKVRMYNRERYISPEIIKPIVPLWLHVRALQIGGEETAAVKKEDVEQEMKQQPVEENTQSEISSTTDKALPQQKMVQLIKELDQGEGALMEEIVGKSHLQNTEKILEDMLEKGDIFQIMPGRVKVL
jgi:RPA family protein